MTPALESGLSADALRNLALAVPLLAVAVAAVVRHLRGDLLPRIAGASLASLWAFTGVLAIEQVQAWWSFAPAPTTAFGMPLEVSLGWMLMWGALPALAGGPWWAWLLGFAWLDVLLMPALSPLLMLEDGWLLGELLLLAAAAAPALLLGHLTTTRTLLGVRVVLQVALFTGLVGWLMPTVAFRWDGTAWADVVDHPYPVRSLLLAGAVITTAPALAAVRELADAGGTPFPWDPPARLVATGPYAYLANPMQLGATALLALLALAAGSAAIGLASVIAAVFSIVLAERHEHAAMATRWPEFAEYRRHVRSWIPRWRPYVPHEATLWVSRECTLCTATGAFVDLKQPHGLRIQPAEEAPTTLTRMTWECQGTRSTGVAAFARALEQTTLLNAWFAWCLRMPVLAQLLQQVADATGLGPRAVVRDTQPAPRPTTTHAEQGAR